MHIVRALKCSGCSGALTALLLFGLTFSKIIDGRKSECGFVIYTVGPRELPAGAVLFELRVHSHVYLAQRWLACNVNLRKDKFIE